LLVGLTVSFFFTTTTRTLVFISLFTLTGFLFVVLTWISTFIIARTTTETGTTVTGTTWAAWTTGEGRYVTRERRELSRAGERRQIRGQRRTLATREWRTVSWSTGTTRTRRPLRSRGE
jgi:hypothetical protein